MAPKTIQDLTNKEIVEDIDYYLNELNMMAPPFCDGRFRIVKEYILELYKRFENE